MPGYDGTGSRGRGPMTGKGDGYCTMKTPEDPHQPGTAPETAVYGPDVARPRHMNEALKQLDAFVKIGTVTTAVVDGRILYTAPEGDRKA